MADNETKEQHSKDEMRLEMEERRHYDLKKGTQKSRFSGYRVNRIRMNTYKIEIWGYTTRKL